MTRIELPDTCKSILFAIKDKRYSNIPKEDELDLYLLEYEGLVEVKRSEFGNALIANLTNKGIVYMHSNPKLKNPSLWEDTKYWITTAFAIIAIIISIISFFI
jgi:hypothetical protein